MICPKCQKENPEGAKFCIECGHPLLTELVCPSCGESNPLGSRFCQKCGLPIAQSAQPPRTAPISSATSYTNDQAGGFPKLGETTKYAGFWRRSAAFVIDLILLAYINWVFSFVIGYLLVAFSNGTEVDHVLLPMGLSVGFYTLIAILPVVYHIGSWALDGQTLGKIAVGAKIVTTDGGPLSIDRAILRYVSYVIALLPLCIGFLLIAADSRRRGLHDMISGTCVVDIRQANIGGMTRVENTTEMETGR